MIQFLCRTEGIDVGYWESLLSQLKAHLARARLRDRHSENLRKKLELLKAEQLGGDDEDADGAKVCDGSLKKPAGIQLFSSPFFPHLALISMFAWQMALLGLFFFVIPLFVCFPRDKYSRWST